MSSQGVVAPLNGVDTLLGRATTLWPLLHRLSTLREIKHELDAAKKRGEVAEIIRLNQELQTGVGIMEESLLQWRPFLHGAGQPSSTDTLGSCSEKTIWHNALAYQQAALVYFYLTFTDPPPDCPNIRGHVDTGLFHCTKAVDHGGPRGALLWPLFVVACEARSPEQREKANMAFAGINERQGMTNIAQSWCIVREIWEQDREGEGKASGLASWMAVAEELGLSILPA